VHQRNQELISSQRSKVSHLLLQGMTPTEADAYVGAYGRARRVLSRINDYATRQIKEKTHSLDSPTAFESPNWQYLVAWWAGYRTAMRITQDLTRTK
jgi:hypothetical protein